MKQGDRSRHDKFARLVAAYQAELPERMRVIMAGWDEIKRRADHEELLETLCRNIHTLAGSAGTFGFVDLGNAARRLEQELVERTTVSTPSADQQGSIDAQLIALVELSRLPPAPRKQLIPEYRPDASETEGNRLIFIVEDDHILADMLAQQLGLLGWQARQFYRVADAQSALQQAVPKAIIADIDLPDGRYAGSDMLTSIRRSHRAILQIIVSSHWDWDSRLRAARADVDAYFVKPVDMSALAERLDELAHRRQETPNRILVLDDSKLLADHYAEVLSGAGFEVHEISEPRQVLAEIAEFSPDLILMDLYMPECNGIEVARVIRQDPKCIGMPIIFLSTEAGRMQQINAMRSGGDDFLTKPIDDWELVAAVKMRVERFRALSQRIRLDSLTGLLNHVAFKLQVENEISRAQRTAAPLILAMIDVDHFKGVNDRYGHPAGDRVLRSLSQLLRMRLRKSDYVGRYGGEEFGILLPETDPVYAIKLVDALREDFAQLKFTVGSDTFTSSFSAGVAVAMADDSVQSLIARADHALYEAKHSGRNRIVQAGK